MTAVNTRGLVSLHPAADPRNVILPSIGADALALATAHTGGLALGSGQHYTWPPGTTLVHVDDYANVHFAPNPLLPPFPFGNFAQGIGDLFLPSFGRLVTSVGMGVICMADPPDFSFTKVGPEFGYPYGYGPMGPVGTNASLTGVDAGSDIGQLKAGAYVIPFNGDRWTRNAFRSGDQAIIDFAAEENYRRMTPSGGDYAAGTLIKFATTPPGAGRAAQFWGMINGSGHLLWGRAQVGAADPGALVTLRGDYGQNETHKIAASGGSFASATLSSDGSLPADGQTVTLGDTDKFGNPISRVFTFRTNPAALYDLKIGGTATECLQHLANACWNGDISGNSYYFAGTNIDVRWFKAPTTVTGLTMVFTASVAGTLANSYVSQTTVPGWSFGAATFSGGSRTFSGSFKVLYFGPAAIGPGQYNTAVGGIGQAVPGSGTVTVDVAAGSTAVTGHNTTWATAGAGQLKVGEWIRFSGDDWIYKIAAVNSDTSLAIESSVPGRTGYAGATTPGMGYVRCAELTAPIPANFSFDQYQSAMEALPSIGAGTGYTGVTLSNVGSAPTLGQVAGVTNVRRLIAPGDFIRITGDPAATLYQVVDLNSDTSFRVDRVFPAPTLAATSFTLVNVAVYAPDPGSIDTAALITFCGALRFKNILISDIDNSAMVGGTWVLGASGSGIPSGDQVLLDIRQGGPQGSIGTADLQRWETILGSGFQIASRIDATGAFNGPAYLSGVPTAPTAPLATNTTQIATTAFVLANAGSGGGGGPPTGAASGDLAGTYPGPTIKASVGLTGVPTAPTAAPATNTTQIASTAFVTAAVAAGGGGGGAPTGPAGGDLAGTYPNPTVKAGVGLTGVPTAPTAAPATNTTQLATTAFVQAALPTSLPPSGTAGGDLSGTYPNPLLTGLTGLNAQSLGSDQNDWAPSLTGINFLKVSATVANVNITGLAGGTVGRIIFLFNGSASTQTVTLKHNSGSSIAANRFACINDLVIPAGGGIVLRYDSLWRSIAGFGIQDAVLLGTPTAATAAPGTATTQIATTAFVAAAKATGNLYLGAASIWPSITSGASANTQVETATNKVNVYAVDFADAATTFAEATYVMPSDWNGGTITAQFVWMANDTTTNAVMWGIQGRAFGDGDLLDQAWGTAVTVTDANASTANQTRISAATAAVTLAGTPAASKMVQFRIERVGGDASDTLAAVARLLGVMIFYTRV